MRKILLVLAKFFPILLFSQTSEIRGSAFYKYNEYIGNRPDAGASVTAYSLQDPKLEKSTTVDLSGAFSVTVPDTGRYFIIVKSKETNDEPYIAFVKLFGAVSLINKYFGVDLHKLNPQLKDQIEQKRKEYYDYLLSSKTKPKKVTEMEIEMMKLVYQFYNLIPMDARSKMGFPSPSDNLFFKEVKITKDGSDKIVVDFGVTYSK